jgi:serine/threonine protein kinase
MGEVYRAKDTRLARDVAIKVLPEEFFEGEEKRQRFEREAKLLASLTHPNVAAVHSFEEISGRHLLVMELIAGKTLRSHLAEGALPLKRLLRIASQVADGLAKTHGAGIVHRDLKPENVMVTDDGFAKILDFGLAKVSKMEAGPSEETAVSTFSKMTTPGTVMGTVAYMSPEQALGRPADFRSDQFSFGSVLYEMVTGKQAFARASAPETMTAIIREEPEPVERAAPGVSVAFRWIVERCLAKDPDERYGSTRDLARDLARLRDGTSDIDAPSPQGSVPTVDPGVALPSVAVLPFANMSADPENEFFADGITEDVIAHLARIRALRVTSRTSVMAFKRREKSLREIGAALGVGVLVEGSVRRSGNRVRIVAQLVDPRTDEHLWAETYDHDLDDIFAIQTDVALQIAAALRAELTLEEASWLWRLSRAHRGRSRARWCSTTA